MKRRDFFKNSVGPVSNDRNHRVNVARISLERIPGSTWKGVNLVDWKKRCEIVFTRSFFKCTQKYTSPIFFMEIKRVESLVHFQLRFFRHWKGFSRSSIEKGQPRGMLIRGRESNREFKSTPKHILIAG